MNNIVAESRKLLKESKLESAKAYLEEQLKATTLPIKTRLECLLLLCRANDSLGKFKENETLAKEIIALSKSNNLDYYYLRGTLVLAEISQRLSIYDKTLQILKTIEKALKNGSSLTFQQKNALQLEVLLLNGAALIDKGESESAFRDFDKIFALINQIEDKDLIGSAYLHIGNYYNHCGKIKESRKYYLKCYETWEEDGSLIAKSKALNNIGITYAMEAQLDLGLEYFLKALDFSIQSGYKMIIANQQANIGIIYQEKGEIDLAYEYFKKAQALFQELDTTFRVAQITLDIGKYYLNKGELEPAFEQLTYAKNLIEKNDYSALKLTVYMLLGQYYFVIMDYSKAKHYLEKSAHYSERIEHNIYLSLALYKLVRTALETKNLKQAKKYLERLEEINALEENKYIATRYKLAQAYILKAEEDESSELTFESLHKTLTRVVTAKQLIYEVINDEIVDYERIVEGIFNLCELLIIELKTLGNEAKIAELDGLIKKLVEIGEAQNAFSLLSKAYLLQGKLELLKPDLVAASRLLNKAKAISKEKGYHRLAKVIQDELDYIDSYYNQLVDGNKLSLLERLGKIKIEGLITSLNQDRVEMYSVSNAAKAPSMKELAGFAQALRKRQVGW
ncbi:MAG: hypothetical protein K9W42_12340 [Candidatus Heimdallarchaeota archaeon]|nr:hypothetical protein [Candidatus Heimdallarchaeota archaeon]